MQNDALETQFLIFMDWISEKPERKGFSLQSHHKEGIASWAYICMPKTLRRLFLYNYTTPMGLCVWTGEWVRMLLEYL